MELKGTIIKVNPVQTVGANGFKKASIWIETADQYPQTIEIEFVKDKADEIQSLAMGTNLTVQININGRKWTNKEGVQKVFNSVQGWKYETDF
jgi:hypothetical protein